MDWFLYDNGLRHERVNKVAGLQLSCEHYEIFKNSFFHETPPVDAFEKSINFPGKNQWRRRNTTD